MKISMILNGKKTEAEIDADMLLIDFVRSQGCYSVKRGCETSNCGLCTVFLEGKPVLSCSVLAARANGCKVDTRENPDPSEEEIKEYLAGNLCRCSGYEGQLRGILNFLAWKKQQGGAS